MKTIKYEIKLERSVKIILGIFAVGIFLNAFATPIFGIKAARASHGGDVHKIAICTADGSRCAGISKMLRVKVDNVD